MSLLSCSLHKISLGDVLQTILEQLRRQSRTNAARNLLMLATRKRGWIYVIHDCGITEAGCHDELIEHNGIYAQLFERQAQSYC